MALTRLILETELAERDGGLLTLVGKDTTPTADPGNPTYSGPLFFAYNKYLGLVPSTAGTLNDGDLLGADPGLFVPLCDLAEYRIIKSCLLNFTEPNQGVSLGHQDFGSMMDRFQALLLDLEKQYAAILNIRRMPTRSGPMKFRFPTPAHPRRWGIGHGRTDH